MNMLGFEFFIFVLNFYLVGNFFFQNLFHFSEFFFSNVSNVLFFITIYLVSFLILLLGTRPTHSKF